MTNPAMSRCKFDFYRPVKTNGFATVVWFHGGGMTAGEKFIPQQLQDQGIAVIAASYRYSSDSARCPAYIDDAAAATAWAFANIENYGGSSNRIFVSGASAGAYLTLMVGLDKSYLARYGIEANRIAGLIPITPQVITHFAVRKERGLKDTQPVVDVFAPLYHVRADAPPIMLSCGDREKELLGRYEENAYFWRMMKIAGHKDISFVEIPGKDHAGVTEPALAYTMPFIRRVVAQTGCGSSRGERPSE